MLQLSVLVLACVLSRSLTQAEFVVKAKSGEAGLPPAIRGTGLTMKFCRVDSTECPGADLSKKFAPAASVCMKRCGKSPKCLNAFYNAKKVCHLRGARCDAAARKASSGLYLHRLKAGESCPADSPDFRSTIPKYSRSFCLMRDKSCPGRDLYKKPQKVSTFLACLKKCAGINECTMVDYSPGKCAIKGESCEDAELTDLASTENYLRLKEGVSLCPGNREVPSETLVPQPAGPAPKPKPTNVPPGYKDDCWELGSFYLYLGHKVTHDVSIKICQMARGKLAEPRNVEEANCLIHKYLARAASKKHVFTHLGLKNTPPYKEGGLVGLSGEDRSDLKGFWSKGHKQPDGSGRPGANCVGVTTTSGSFSGSLYGEFHDIGCKDKHGFVCEYRI